MTTNTAEHSRNTRRQLEPALVCGFRFNKNEDGYLSVRTDGAAFLAALRGETVIGRAGEEHHGKGWHVVSFPNNSGPPISRFLGELSSSSLISLLKQTPFEPLIHPPEKRKARIEARRNAGEIVLQLPNVPNSDDGLRRALQLLPPAVSPLHTKVSIILEVDRRDSSTDNCILSDRLLVVADQLGVFSTGEIQQSV